MYIFDINFAFYHKWLNLSKCISFKISNSVNKLVVFGVLTFLGKVVFVTLKFQIEVGKKYF